MKPTSHGIDPASRRSTKVAGSTGNTLTLDHHLAHIYDSATLGWIELGNPAGNLKHVGSPPHP